MLRPSEGIYEPRGDQGLYAYQAVRTSERELPDVVLGARVRWGDVRMNQDVNVRQMRDLPDTPGDQGDPGVDT